MKSSSRSIAIIASLTFSIVRSGHSEESVSNDVQTSPTFTYFLESGEEGLGMLVVRDGTFQN
ncbi:MAG: hypothetical protein F4X44_08795 [Gammaproteobacteria bacterium]|nr:hypothetical protein [Gammaproteobacteria bacterium]MYD80695.1 hypothetical protein [Gammaproteobacteria bacterium]